MFNREHNDLNYVIKFGAKYLYYHGNNSLSSNITNEFYLEINTLFKLDSTRLDHPFGLNFRNLTRKFHTQVFKIILHTLFN